MVRSPDLEIRNVDKPVKPLKEMSDREQAIDARAKAKGITRAAAAQEIDRESAAKQEK